IRRPTRVCSTFLSVLFLSSGDQVLLPYCANSSSQSFSEVNCLYQKDKSTSGNVVIRGEVVQSSAGASRLSVSRNSLLIRNISAEDAGLYVCIQPQCPAFIYLSILSSEYLTSSICQHCQETLQLVFFSPSPPDVHGNVKLHCSLISIDDQVSCQRSSILWENETGNELIGEKAELEVGGRRNCDSVLTVKHTTENNRRFTCKFVKNKEVKIDAVYVAAFTGKRQVIIRLKFVCSVYRKSSVGIFHNSIQK
uniref:Ig-like domain-containing protein n=1 Tax=Oryzias latipes TaxID=8090 RepID=A0A3P9KCN8_ORYLA